jgi:hypothetical protein
MDDYRKQYQGWNVEDLPAEYAKIVLRRENESKFYLPTECVIREPKFFVPDQGSYWSVYSVRNGSRVGSRKGILVEHWVNNGDDGHTQMKMSGYYLIPTEEEVETFIKGMLGYWT